MFITLAPIRRPVKEPGPDIKVISVMSCQVLLFSFSLSWRNFRSCSARLLPSGSLYSRPSNFRMVSGVEVSK